MKTKFLSGKYYVGDLCYSVKDENWSGLCDKFFSEELNEDYLSNGLVFDYNGVKCFAGSTKYGDGEYFDNYGRSYGVDAGLIGVMPFSACDGDSMYGGQVMEFDSDFVVYYNDGFFKFSDIEIETDGNDSEEFEDEYWEYND